MSDKTEQKIASICSWCFMAVAAGLFIAAIVVDNGRLGWAGAVAFVFSLLCASTERHYQAKIAAPDKAREKLIRKELEIFDRRK